MHNNQSVKIKKETAFSLQYREKLVYHIAYYHLSFKCSLTAQTLIQ